MADYKKSPFWINEFVAEKYCFSTLDWLARKSTFKCSPCSATSFFFSDSTFLKYMYVHTLNMKPLHKTLHCCCSPLTWGNACVIADRLAQTGMKPTSMGSSPGDISEEQVT